MEREQLLAAGNQRRLPLTCQSSWTASASHHQANLVPPDLAAEAEGKKGRNGEREGISKGRKSKVEEKGEED